jgi:hypothetical protein
LKLKGLGVQSLQALRRFYTEDMPMADPLDKATSGRRHAGEGCLSRYDPDDLSPEDGTEFPGAAQLWEQLQEQPEKPPKPA